MATPWVARRSRSGFTWALVLLASPTTLRYPGENAGDAAAAHASAGSQPGPRRRRAALGTQAVRGHHGFARVDTLDHPARSPEAAEASAAAIASTSRSIRGHGLGREPARPDDAAAAAERPVQLLRDEVRRTARCSCGASAWRTAAPIRPAAPAQPGQRSGPRISTAAVAGDLFRVAAHSRRPRERAGHGIRTAQQLLGGVRQRRELRGRGHEPLRVLHRGLQQLVRRVSSATRRSAARAPAARPGRPPTASASSGCTCSVDARRAARAGQDRPPRRSGSSRATTRYSPRPRRDPPRRRRGGPAPSRSPAGASVAARREQAPRGSCPSADRHARTRPRPPPRRAGAAGCSSWLPCRRSRRSSAPALICWTCSYAGSYNARPEERSTGKDVPTASGGCACSVASIRPSRAPGAGNSREVVPRERTLQASAGRSGLHRGRCERARTWPGELATRASACRTPASWATASPFPGPACSTTHAGPRAARRDDEHRIPARHVGHDEILRAPRAGRQAPVKADREQTCDASSQVNALDSLTSGAHVKRRHLAAPHTSPALLYQRCEHAQPDAGHRRHPEAGGARLRPDLGHRGDC